MSIALRAEICRCIIQDASVVSQQPLVEREKSYVLILGLRALRGVVQTEKAFDVQICTWFGFFKT